MTEHFISSDNTKLDREETIDFLSKIFGTDYADSRTVQETMFDAEPSMTAENFIFARSRQEELVGLVRIVERNILLDGSAITAGCISSVAVKAEWQGKGIAKDLINSAIDVMTSRGMDISIVYGRRAVDGFYPKFGYCGVGRYVDLEITSGTDSDDLISTAPCNKEYIETCMSSYEIIYGNLSGSVLRGRSLWEYLFLRLERNIGGFKAFVCLEKEKTIGYLVVLNKRLIEISVPDRFYSSVPNLLRRLNVNSISIHPRHPLYIFCRTHMNTIQKERFALDGGYMARVLNPGSLLKKIGPLLSSRAAVFGASDKCVNLLGHEVSLSTGQVIVTSEAENINFNNPETTVQLLLGVIRPEDIPGITWTDNKSWIPYVFPNLHYYTSAWDEV